MASAELKSPKSDLQGQSAWLSSGLEIEEDQISLQRFVQELGQKQTLAQKLDLTKRRQRLKGKIIKFEAEAQKFLGFSAVATIRNANSSGAMEEQHGVGEEEQLHRPTGSTHDAEWEVLVFPSIIPHQLQDSIPHYTSVLNKEITLRTGQANDALQHIREALSQLAYQFRHNVRLASSTAQTTRAWDGVHLLTKEWKDLRRIYGRARETILKVRNDEKTQSQFPELTIDDCRISPLAVDGNARDQSDARLSWLWRTRLEHSDISVSRTDMEDKYILECEFIYIQSNASAHIQAVYRIHWLRARARFKRWTEELVIVQHEMSWTVRYFTHMAKLWSDRRSMVPNVLGAREYAERQVTMWNEFGRVADETYAAYTSLYKPAWKPIA